MTLIATVKCSDGYLVASDTAIAFGETSYQAHKITQYQGGTGTGRYQVIVASSGWMGLGQAISEKIRDEVAAMQNAERSIQSIKAKVSDAVFRLHKQHIADLDIVFTAVGAIE